MNQLQGIAHALVRRVQGVYRLSIAMARAAVHGPKPLPSALVDRLSPLIMNSCIVTPKALWRGGHINALGAQALVDLGVKTVVNLQFLHDDLDEFETTHSAVSNQIEYFRIQAWEPFVVIAPQRLDAHIAEFIAIVKTQPLPVYVHCRSGQNRTGVMVAAYRVLIENWAIEAAVAEMGHFQGVWFKLYAETIRSLVGEHRARIERLARQFEGTAKREAMLQLSPTGCSVKA
jgi:protein-tyrosine phosphatase